MKLREKKCSETKKE